MNKTLHLKFHGKILDQLGFQTYQTPVASLSEMVANAWDADAKTVDITLPDNNESSAQIIIEDDGNGMTFNECPERYLNVGYDRRNGNPLAKTLRGRNTMGRKGIGKFAGFGIANKIQIETTSSNTGEKTIFEMDINKLKSDEYVKEGGNIHASTTSSDESLREHHGTKVILKEMNLRRTISESSFRRSLSRRFLVHQTSNDFEIRVNGTPIAKTEDLSNVEFTFPRDYKDKIPDELIIKDGWGIEKLSNGKVIKWKFFFNKDTISDEDLQGVTIFANGKLVQKPFFFNLTGGLGGQAGQSYMFGQVVADFVDQLSIDPISTERQRINWELSETVPLLEWGQKKVKYLLSKWHVARGEKKHKMLEEKISDFAIRLDNLGKHEKKTVTKVLTKLGGISSISQKKYEELADSIITSWEGGRLQELWTEIVNTEELSESDLLSILMETEVVSALNVAEAIKTKLYAISELKSRIMKKDLENAVRVHLAKNPWMISPKWDTFKVERKVTNLIKEQAEQSGLSDDTYQGRVDLVLSSGSQLLVLEFMRPGLTLNWDHISRCKRYINYIQAKIDTQTASEFTSVSGYIVADKVDKDSAVSQEIKNLKQQNVVVNDWKGLLDNAKSSWNEYLHILIKRGNGDIRLQNLLDD